MKTYKTKIIISGNVVEVYQYEKPVAYDFRERSERQRGKRDPSDPREGRRPTSLARTRNELRRKILANFTNESKFVTLTFAENVTDLDRANGEFKKFIQRLRRRYGNFKYVAVIEFQKRGAVHYHMISNLTYVKKAELAEIWQNGFVQINRIKHVDNVGAYVIKYMTKDTADPRLNGRKAYLASRNLDEPIEYAGEIAEQLLAQLIKEKEPVYSSEYESEYNGLVKYTEYNLTRENQKTENR